MPQIRRLLVVYAEERSRLGLPTGPQPLRRDMSFGADGDDALHRFVGRAAGRYRAYAAKEHRGFGGDSEELEKSIASHRVFGTMDQCVDAVAAIAGEMPVDPLIVRPHWPEMDTAAVVAEIERLGELASALADIPPVERTSDATGITGVPGREG